MKNIALDCLNLGWWWFLLYRVEGSETTQLAEIYAKLEEIEADKAPARYLKFSLSVSHFVFPSCELFQLCSSISLFVGHQSFLLGLALLLKCSSSLLGEWALPFLALNTVGSAPTCPDEPPPLMNLCLPLGSSQVAGE
jgi:hypothetical protein